MSKLIVVQGATQALAVISVINDEQQRDLNAKTDIQSTHFLVGDLCSSDSDEKIFSSVERVIKSFGYSVIHDTRALDKKFIS